MKAIVWTKPGCTFCDMAKGLLKQKGIEYEERNIAEGWDVQDLLKQVPTGRTMPQIWLDDKHVGGYYELEKALQE